MLKKIFILMFSMILVVGSAFPTYAGDSISDLKEKQKQIDSQISQYRNQAAALKNEKNNVQAQINSLDNEINAINLEVQSQELKKQELNMQISDNEQQIKKINSEIDANNQLLEERLRTMYKKGTSGYIEVMLKSKNLTDALTRADMVQMIVENDVDLLKSIEEQKKQVEEIKISLQGEKDELTVVINDLQAKQSQVETASNSKEQYMSSIEHDLASVQKMKAAEEAQAAQIEKDILALQDTSVKYAGGKMLWPCPSSQRITSFFGKREEPISGAGTNHGAIDIGARSGSAAVAANDGVVIFAGWHYSYGNYIIVDHGGGIATLYAHNSKLLVSKGDKVKRGQTISLVGSTGYSTGPHLHFEVRVNGIRVNPLSYLR